MGQMRENLPELHINHIQSDHISKQHCFNNIIHLVSFLHPSSYPSLSSVSQNWTLKGCDGFLSICLTDDYRLGFTLDSNSCTGAGSNFHMIHHSHLQPAHHHRAYGCVHRLIYMKTCLVPKTPNLKIKKKRTVILLCRSEVRIDYHLVKQTLYSRMMPFWWSGGGGSQEMLMEVLFGFPTVRTITCWGGALGAEKQVGSTVKHNI